MKRLHIKMPRVAKGIKRWKKEKIGDTRLQLAIVKEVLLQLEVAQEHRLLTDQKLDLRHRLKARSMGLAAIEKTRIRQRSRLTYIRCGDANTKFFHIRASARRRKNYIHCLYTDEGIAIAHEEKEKVIQDYFRITLALWFRGLQLSIGSPLATPHMICRTSRRLPPRKKSKIP